MKTLTFIFMAFGVALTTINLIIFKEAKDMAAVYVALIVKGKRTYSSVPITVKEKVREMLIDLEMEELIAE